jgi:hypothetical protein
MTYSIESLHDMAEGMAKNVAALQELKASHAHLGMQFNGALQEHLLHGVCRRLDVIRLSLSNIFCHFPPSRTEKLGEADLSNVQINLHAFCINVAGIFDNWAWAFTLHHDLLDKIGGKHGVGLFKKGLFGFLPPDLCRQVDSMRSWHDLYLKEYRDALAHRIPLYIPPFVLYADETDRYRELEKKRHELLFSHEFDQYEEVSAQLESMGSASDVFLHSFDFGDHYRPVHVHPQVLCDCETVVEFGRSFLTHWRGRA